MSLEAGGLCEEGTHLTLDLYAELQSRSKRAQKGAGPRFSWPEAALGLPAQNEPDLVMILPAKATAWCDTGGFEPALSKVRWLFSRVRVRVPQSQTAQERPLD